MQSPTKLTLGASIVLASSLVATSASAQSYVAPSTGVNPPTFTTMDQVDGTSKVGGQIDFTLFDDAVDATGVRFQIGGHYVTPSGFGGYASLPISHLMIDNVEDESAIGNAEVGGLYVIPRGNVDIVLRGGLTLPTADDDSTGAIVNTITTYSRLTDLILAYPETLALRLSASPIIRSGQMIFRVDGGIDFAMSSPGDEPDPLLRLNLGGGVDTGQFAVLGELATIGNLEGSEEWAHTLAITARFFAGPVEPGIAIGFPLDDNLRDVVDMFLSVGLQARI